MNRRLGGVVLLVATLVGTLALAAVNRPGTGGQAMPIAMPGPPSPGMCADREIALPTGSSSSVNAFGDVLGNPYGPCSATSMGEVVAVLESVHDSEEVDARCRAAMNVYLGLPEKGTVDAGGQQWAPENQFRVLAVGPTLRQQAARQDWTACVLVLMSWASPTAQASLVHLPASARDALAGGPSDDSFGVCGDSAVRWIPCSRPHAVQWFGQTWGPSSGVARVDIVRECRAVVARLSGAPDPTFNGRLEIFIDASYVDANGKKIDGFPAGPSPDATVTCGVRVVAGDYLVGSLIGIGDGEPHWAS